MSKVCHVCKRRPLFGNNVSHSQRKTRRRWDINLQSKKLANSLKVKICTTCIKDI